MRKKSFQNSNLLYRYYKKFCNIQKRIRLLMQSGEFFNLPREIQHRLVRRLRLLYERIQRLAGKQMLRWAGAVMALMFSVYVANAQEFEDPVLMSGFTTGLYPSTCFVDFDGDGDQDIMIGEMDGGVNYIEAENGRYSPYESLDGVDGGDYSVPALADLDGDGDLDLLLGNWEGTFIYYRNDDGDFTELTGTDNPFDGEDVGYTSAPVFFDVDDDGDPDMITGTAGGEVLTYENNSGTFTALVGADNPFDGIESAGTCSFPGFADCDNDGDMDLYIGSKYGTIDYAENDGGNFTVLTGTDNPFNAIIFEADPSIRIDPAVLDIDDDNDPDLVVADDSTRVLRYFENTAGTFVEKRGTPNPFEGLLTRYVGAPAFSDMDNDGDLDLLISEKYGAQRYYERMGEGYVPKFDDLTYDTIAAMYLKPTFGDLNGDDADDLLVGDAAGVLHYFEKQGADNFIEVTGGDNPFDGVIDTNYAAPVLVDLDGDGDLDCVVGNSDYNDYGRMSYYEYDGGTFTPQLGADNPFNDIQVVDSIPSSLNPAFADIDTDGDLDLFIGCKYTGEILYYVNDGGVFTQTTGTDNPFDVINLGPDPTLAFNDEDGDGDLDLFISSINFVTADGVIYYFENITEGNPPSVPNIEQENGMKIYSKEKTIYLDADDQLIERVEVYSMSGALVTSKNIGNTGMYELTMPDASSGIYLVRAFSNGVPTTNKVLLR